MRLRTVGAEIFEIENSYIVDWVFSRNVADVLDMAIDGLDGRYLHG